MAVAVMAMPQVRYADLTDVRIAYYEAGEENRPTVVLCHGFPETAFSWRHQIAALSHAGWRVIAPDMRGYGRSSRPTSVEEYDAVALCSDLIGLLGHLRLKQAVFVGHDWGGAVVWQLAMRQPEYVFAVASLNTPFQVRAPADPVDIMRRRMGDEMYMVHFQKYGEPDDILNADVRRTLDYFFRRAPVTGRASRGYSEARESNGGSAFPLVREIEAYNPARDGREKFLSDEEFETYVSAFESTGFTGGINWYRNITRNWVTAAGYEHVIRKPALMILAENDPWLPPVSAQGMEDIVPGLEKVLIKNCGHWSQQEQPEAVSHALLDWLERHCHRATS